MRSVRWLHVLILPAVVLACPNHAFAQAVVSDDASVTAATDANFGSNPNLNVSSTRSTYVKFQLSSVLPDGTPGSAIQRATVQLYIGNVTAPGRLDVFAVQDAWNEATITGVTAPPPALLVATTDRIPVEAKSQFLTIDVTSLVRQWLGDDGAGQNGISNQGIAIVARVDANETANITFDSKENSQTSHEPRLSIELASAPTAGVTAVTADAPLFVANGSSTPNVTLGTVTAAFGGTGLTTSGAAGSFLRSTGNAWTSAPLLAGDIPPGSGSYIQNGIAVQGASNFNISGSGAAAVFNAGQEFELAGERVLANPGNSNLYVGRNTGTSSTSGAANTYVGNNAGSKSTTAIRNTFVGADAGRNTVDGGQNSFFGTDAGKANTSGFFNAFFGDGAGGLNTTGRIDSFFGTFAGAANTDGIRNVFVGFEAGLSNTIGSSNTFLGTESGKLTTTGGGNTYVGDLAGVVATTASFNTFAGFRTGEHIDTGSDNAFFGIRAGDLTTTGNRNAFLGRDVGFQNVAGDDNTFVGSFSDFTGANTSGAGNTLLGAGTRVDPDLSNAGAMGFRAQVTESNALVLGSIAGVNGAGASTSVGIGTTAPRARLDVTGGDVLVASPGQGVILRSPNGSVCRRLSIDDNGNLALVAVACQ